MYYSISIISDYYFNYSTQKTTFQTNIGLTQQNDPKNTKKIKKKKKTKNKKKKKKKRKIEKSKSTLKKTNWLVFFQKIECLHPSLKKYEAMMEQPGDLI